MATFRVVRTVIEEAFIEAADLDSAWERLDTDSINFYLVDERDEVHEQS